MKRRCSPNYLILQVFQSFSTGIRPASQALPLRVLLKVHKKQSGPGTTPGQMHLEAPSGHRNIPLPGPVSVRGGWERQQDLLPEPVPVGKVVFGP